MSYQLQITGIGSIATLEAGIAYINGTTPYQGALQVKTNGGGILINTDNSNFGIALRNSSSTNKLWDISSFNNDLVINEGAVATRLYFKAGGNIGINNTTPLFALDVTGTGRYTGQLTLGSTITNGTFTYTLPGATGTLALTSDIPTITANAPLSYVGGVLSISQATTSTNGYLSSTDWNTFNNKQASGNYITALTGEATASGPGSAAVTLTNSAVIGKVLTGLNVTGGTVVSTDSVLSAFGKVQNQINSLLGGVTYQGSWDASTNTPTLTSSVGTKGYYYIVSVAGSTNLNGITDWQIGDWAIYNGSAWQKVDNTDSVVSVNGFTGAVNLTTSNISEGSNLYFTNTRAQNAISLTTTGSSGLATYSGGVLNIPNYGSALSAYVPYTGATSDLNLGTKNLYVNNVFDGFNSIAASGTQVVLTVASVPSYLVTGSGGQTIKLPDATTLPNGAVYVFNNNQSSGAISVNNNSNTLVVSIPSGGYCTLELLDNTSAAGSWDRHFQAPSNVSWSTNTFDYPGSITSATWNGNVVAINRGGTGASTASGALSNLGGIGLTSLSASSPLSYNNTTGVFTIQQANGSQSGYLSSTDWTTFNNKQNAIGYTPANDSLVVHLAGTETITGDKTFNGNVDFNNSAYLNSGVFFRNNAVGSTLYTNFSILKSGSLETLNYLFTTGNSSKLVFNDAANYTYTFPTTSGTIALTSDIPSLAGYVPTSRTLTINGTTYDLSANRSWTINSMVYPSAGIAVSTGTAWGASITDNSTNWNTAYSLRITSASAPLSITSNVLSISQATTSTNGYLSSTDWNIFNGKQSTITLTTTGSSGAATFSGGTLNIPNYGSALSSYVPYSGATSSVNIGNNPFSSRDVRIDGDSSANFGFLGFKQFSSGTSGINGYTSIYASSTNSFSIAYSQSAGVVKTATFLSNLIANNTAQSYYLPAATGTLALTNTLISGSVMFAGASGVLQQDNSNLFWDDTNNILLIGKNSSVFNSKGIEINGSIYSEYINTNFRSQISSLGGEVELISAIPDNSLRYQLFMSKDGDYCTFGYFDSNTDDANYITFNPSYGQINTSLGPFEINAYGDISFYPSQNVIMYGKLLSQVDNTFSLGQSGRRWSSVWAVNGTIQTSDQREKNTIIDSDLGLEFINKLRPVSFKWNVGENIVTNEEDGIDEKGKKKFKEVITPREGKRTHYGLIAQEVEALLDGKDFGGFIYDKETDIKGLRYDQFVPILIKAMQEQNQTIQEQNQTIQELNNRLKTLENK